jgi:hypothetical protein
LMAAELDADERRTLAGIQRALEEGRDPCA